MHFALWKPPQERKFHLACDGEFRYELGLIRTGKTHRVPKFHGFCCKRPTLLSIPLLLHTGTVSLYNSRNAHRRFALKRVIDTAIQVQSLVYQSASQQGIQQFLFSFYYHRIRCRPSLSERIEYIENDLTWNHQILQVHLSRHSLRPHRIWRH